MMTNKIKMFISHDPNVATSYDMYDWIDKVFRNPVDVDEVRDSLGYLKGFDVKVDYDRPVSRNIRINVYYLTEVCKILGDVHVTAAGGLYATVRVSSEQIKKLNDNDIFWEFD